MTRRNSYIIEYTLSFFYENFFKSNFNPLVDNRINFFCAFLGLGYYEVILRPSNSGSFNMRTDYML